MTKPRIDIDKLMIEMEKDAIEWERLEKQVGHYELEIQDPAPTGRLNAVRMNLTNEERVQEP